MQSTFVFRIDQEIERKSLLKHAFYQLWSKGELHINHLQGYSKEYFQLVKSIPGFVGNIITNSSLSNASYFANDSFKEMLNNSMQEESDHVEPWIDFATSLGVSKKALLDYQGSDKTNKAIEDMRKLTQSSVSQGAERCMHMKKSFQKLVIPR